MLIGDIPRWALLLLLVSSGVVTLATVWAVELYRRGRGITLGASQAVALQASPSHVGWAGLLFCGYVLGIRYAERLATPVMGYAGVGLASVVISLVRAELYRRAVVHRSPGARWGQAWLDGLTGVLFAAVVYLLVAAIGGLPARPALFLPLAAGALLPGLDDRESLTGRLLPFLARPIEVRWGRKGAWHSLGAGMLVAVLTSPLVALRGPAAWALFLAGFGCRLVLDAFHTEGVMLFWPLSPRRFNILGGPLGVRQGAAARQLLPVLCIAAGILLLVVDLSPVQPPTSPAPTYEQSLQRYQRLRGRYLLFADVSGAWQLSSRRVSARFEILGAEGGSLILLDRYTRRIFTGGQSASDHLYVYSLNVVAGSSVRVKPVEVHLVDEDLAAVAPVLHAMQSEPGIEHILISGELVVAEDVDDRALPIEDLALDRLPKIVRETERHYSLHYLDAGELIALASLAVAQGELVVTATYVSPAAGATATPLPPAPAGGSTSATQEATP